MKKAIFSLAAMALVLASCDSNNNDSYQTLTFPESNLIIDNSNESAAAQVSKGSYIVKNNFSKYCVDIKTTELIINNQKYSFETDTMALRPKSVTINVDGKDMTYTNILFSKNGSAGIGSAASNLSGAFVWIYMPVGTDILSPDYNVTVGQRLDLRYSLSDRYTVQTFWPTALYRGETTASDGNVSHTTKKSDYLAQIDFEKNLATVYVYNAEFSAGQDDTFPKVIRFENMPVTYTHEGFSIKASAPTTTVLGTKDGKTDMVPSDRFKATDFSFELVSRDLTEAAISYNLDGKNIDFKGCSIVKAGY